MTREEKELLLKDLSARLPYRVRCECRNGLGGGATDMGVLKFIGNCSGVISNYYEDVPIDSGFVNNVFYPVENIKPYLRPLSSMTEGEKEEFIRYAGYEVEESVNGRHYEYYLKDYVGTPESPTYNYDSIDWLNSRHFDYRGLIGKGLALEAPEWMYKSMKLVSYMYSYSGDGGLCLSNRKEWDANERYLYFDAEKWTMEKIYDTVKTLYRKYESLGPAWTLGEVMDRIRDTMVPFINETDGVYRDKKFSWVSINKEKRIDPREHEIIPWELDGRTCNLDYDK